LASHNSDSQGRREAVDGKEKSSQNDTPSIHRNRVLFNKSTAFSADNCFSVAVTNGKAPRSGEIMAARVSYIAGFPVLRNAERN
jgi:hypothetical protein